MTYEQLPIVTELLYVCWLVWDKLNTNDQQFAINVLNYQARQAMDYKIEYNFNPDGSSTNLDDCQTILNMDHANLLYLISVMVSKTNKATVLREKAILAYRACFSSQNDGDMQGYNVAEDMLLHRFDTRSPFATSYIGVGIKAKLVLRPSGLKLYSILYPLLVWLNS